MKLDIAKIKREIELRGIQATANEFGERLAKRDIKPQEVSIRQLWEAFVVDKKGRHMGTDSLREIDENLEGNVLSENTASAISTGDFSNVLQQFAFGIVSEPYSSSEFGIADSFYEYYSNVYNVEEKIPGVSNAGDTYKVVAELKETPSSGHQEDFVLFPKKRKWMSSKQVSWEAIRFDRTGLLVMQIEAIRDEGRLSRELEAIDTLIAVNGASDYNGRYKWRDENTAVSPWQTSATASPYYVNKLTGGSANPLTAFPSCINTTYKTLAAIVDPFTNLPMSDKGGYVLWTTPDHIFDAQRLKRLNQYRTGTPTSSNNELAVSDGASVVDFEVKESRLLKTRLVAGGGSTDTWFFLNPRESLMWSISQPLTIEVGLTNAGTAFSNDFGMLVRGKRVEVAGWRNPRYAVQNNAT